MSVYAGPEIVNDGLVLAVDAANPKSYPGSGTTWFDLSKNEINGTLTNGPSFNTGNNGSIDFDGIDDLCSHSTNLTEINNITNSSSFTLSTTFRLNAYPTVQTATTTGLLMKGSYNPSYGINLAYSGSSGGFRTLAKIYYGLRNLTGTAGVTQGYGIIGPQSNASIDLGQWYKVDMVHEFSGTTHTLRLYINGKLDKQDVDTNALYPINFQNTESLGINFRLLGGNFLYSNLTVASYSIYTRALTEQEIQQNFNATRGRFGI